MLDMYADHRMLVSEAALFRRRFNHIARRLVPIVARPAIIPFHFDRPVQLDYGAKLAAIFARHALAYSPVGAIL